VSRRSLVTTIASGALALVLLIALVRFSQVDLTQLGRLLANIKLAPSLALVGLVSLHVLLAGEKWRLVYRRMAPGAELSRRLCFCFTAIGTAAGQVLPMQLATALARSICAHLVTGSGAVRSALATIFEQLFDIVVVALCALASFYCLWSNDLSWWSAIAAAALAIGFVLAGPVLGRAAAAAQWLATRHATLAQRIRALGESGLFEPRLTRHLFALSVLRLAVLWLMAVATAYAAGLNISALQLAAALPLVVLATVLVVTPGGIGVNEWTFAAALTALGADFETAAQFALVNRVLVAVASLMIGAAGVALAHLAGKNAGSALADRQLNGRPQL
jgi:uncharacterized membrane protein YbhN (UPF0104 family)